MRLRLGRWVGEGRIVGLVGGLFVSFVSVFASILGLLFHGFTKRGFKREGKVRGET